MSWKPSAVVTVGGVSYSDKALEGLSITYGRQDTNEQARAGYCRVSLIAAGDSALPISLLQPVTVDVLNTAGTAYVRLFTGTVSDLSKRLEATGDAPTIVSYELTAVSGLARLIAATAGGAGLAAELDGNRVRSIVSGALDTLTWQTYPSNVTWANASGTWNNVSGIIEQIDAGVYELAAYTGGEANAYELIVQAASSGLGQLYETTDGRIGYAEATRRVTDAVAGYVEIPADYVLVDGIALETNSGDVLNAVTVNYASGSEYAEDVTSIGKYGLQASSVDTQLSNATDAQARAVREVELHREPRESLTELSIPVHLDGISGTLRDALLEVSMGLPVKVPGVPAAMLPTGTFTGFVEGWSWRLGEYALDLTLTVSDYALTAVSMRWLDVAPAETWATLNPSLTWSNAFEVS